MAGLRRGSKHLIPYDPLVPVNPQVDVGRLIAYSKAKHGAVVEPRQQENATIEFGEEEVKIPATSRTPGCRGTQKARTRATEKEPRTPAG